MEVSDAFFGVDTGSLWTPPGPDRRPSFQSFGPVCPQVQSKLWIAQGLEAFCQDTGNFFLSLNNKVSPMQFFF